MLRYLLSGGGITYYLIQLALVLPIILLSLSLHESAHAYAAYKLGDLEVKVAVASGTKNARELLNKVKSGEVDVQFIEIMACPGGCVNGGGQPIQPQYVRDTTDIKALRAKALYDADRAAALRKSHKSPGVCALYGDGKFFESYGCHKAHEYLHTSYVARKKY